ncbi:MAG TPA: EF-P lysine aminoacylase EpmA, partial [Stellaceae bacterium]|nr:EF-P lysine aminoacylase EpmA [Stellaceae bacterium]
MAKAPWWRQDVFASRAANLQMRGAMLRATRQFFESQGFAEVETPALQASPGLEPHLKAFATSLEEPGAGKRRIFLHTSPEFAMKKLLAAGVPLLFQLAHAFRNAERSDTHHPEFMLLEWYRAGATYRDLMKDCEALLRHTLKAAGRTSFTYKGKSADPAQAWQRLSVAEAFERFAGIDLLATAPNPLKPALKLLAKAAKPLGISPHRGDSWEDLFFRIFLERIEPNLGSPAPTLLYDYPLSMAALARAKPGDPRLAERVELYVCGLELANGFSELTDAREQRARFARDRSAKRRIYGLAYPVDEDFLAALEAGLPESAGMALGFDRLVMLASGASRIDEVLWAPVG